MMVLQMTFIPVIHSIPSGDALITTVLPNYPIGKAHTCLLYKRGLNDTYLVETERKRYILRIYRKGWRTKEEIDFELDLLAFLHSINQPIAYPIQRQDGSCTTEIPTPEGNRYAALFSYAPARAVNEIDSEQKTRSYSSDICSHIKIAIILCVTLRYPLRDSALKKHLSI